jgi:peptidyl-prolyl cis-trans isomerase D
MLQKIRDKITGWIAAVFLGAIAVVFVFWGIDFQSNANTYAVKVNGEKVPVQTVQRAWQQRLSQMQQMLRGEVPPDLVKAQQTAMLDQFVQQTLLKQRAEDFGYQVNDEALATRVREIAQFQADGKFSVDRYNAMLRQAGFTTSQFETDLRSELLIAQVQNAVVDSSFALPYEVERRYVLDKQEREIDYALIAANSFASQVHVTDPQIQAWYEKNKSQFMSPETVDLEYLEITRAMAEARVDVTETALRDYFESVKDRYETPERRRARHILITAENGVDDAAAEKKAAELTAQAKAGANFEELAKKSSKDPGSAQQGGDLGWAQRGMFVGPFEEALFAMSQGEIRGPIKTQFGYHVLRLDEIETGHLKSFEEARAELEAEFRKDRAQAILSDESQKLDEQSFAALTELTSVAKALELPIKRVDGFTREGGGELGADPEIIKAAFSEDVLERGQNSPIIAAGDDRAIVLRAVNHKPAEPRPLAEVRPQIEAQIRTQAMRDAAAKLGAEALARLQKGEAWSAVAAELKLQPVGRRFVTRQDQVVPGAILRAAFDVSRSQANSEKPYVAGVATDDGNYAVWALSAVRAPAAAAEPAEQKLVRQQQTARQVGSEEFATYLKEAERTAKISRNEKVFE